MKKYQYEDIHSVTRSISKALLDTLVDGDYPRNSQGETYGSTAGPSSGGVRPGPAKRRGYKRGARLYPHGGDSR